MRARRRLDDDRLVRDPRVEPDPRSTAAGLARLAERARPGAGAADAPALERPRGAALSAVAAHPAHSALPARARGPRPLAGRAPVGGEDADGEGLLDRGFER